MAKADTVGLTNASKLNYRGDARESRISTGHGRDTGKFLKSVRHQYIIGARLEQQNSSRSRPQNWSRVSRTDLKRDTGALAGLVTGRALALTHMLGLGGDLTRQADITSMSVRASSRRCSPPSICSKTSTRSRGFISAKIAK